MCSNVCRSFTALKVVPEFQNRASSAKTGKGNSEGLAVTFASGVVSDGVEARRDSPGGGASSLSSRSKGSGPGEEPTHINLFIWIRLLLHRFQLEQSHRAAAVRLMFDTASVGALTPQNQSMGTSVVPSAPGTAPTVQAPDEGNHIEFPQFLVRQYIPFATPHS